MKTIQCITLCTALIASAAAHAVTCRGLNPESMGVHPDGCIAVEPPRGGKQGRLVSSTNVETPQTPPASSPDYGPTLASIKTQFPLVMEWNWRNSRDPNATLAKMPDVTLARMTREYYIERKGVTTTLDTIMAQRLTAANLKRYAAAMGQSSTDAVVNLYAPAAVKASYHAMANHAMVPRSEANYKALAIGLTTPAIKAGAVTGWLGQLDMTANDIYLDYYTATPEATQLTALAETGNLLWKRFALAWSIGYSIGSTIYFVDDKINPAINIAIGNEIGGAVDDVVNFMAAPDPGASGYVDIPGFYDFDIDTWDWCDADSFC
jgi:hypothetical protein